MLTKCTVRAPKISGQVGEPMSRWEGTQKFCDLGEGPPPPISPHWTTLQTMKEAWHGEGDIQSYNKNCSDQFKGNVNFLLSFLEYLILFTHETQNISSCIFLPDNINK